MEQPGYTGRRPRGRISSPGPANAERPDYEIKPIKRFKPKKNPKIGIGITTHNRHENARRCLTNILLCTPEAHRIVVVDDASDIPFENADFRFRHNVGIAKAKNKCIEMLDDCDYIFLFDDDCWPEKVGWWRPYVESGVHHMSFTFSQLHDGRPNRNDFLKNEGEISYYKNPCGCMLFMTKELVEKIGGFDIGFGQYGNEHVDFSVRAYFADMIAHPFMDIAYSLMLFHSLDYYMDTQTSVKSRMGIWNTKSLIGRKSSNFVPYRSVSERFLVLTSYFTYKADPQRGIKWEADVNKVMALVNSVVDHGGEVAVFHDCFEDTPYIPGVKWYKCEPDNDFVPNVWRYYMYLAYLQDMQPKIPVFMTDSTDVVCLSAPKVVKKYLYVGDEANQILDNVWMRTNQEPLFKDFPDYRNVINKDAASKLYNCGVIGGEASLVERFLIHYCAVSNEHCMGLSGSTDMAVSNYVFYKYFRDCIISGQPVNTRFKYFERDNGVWFQHK